MGSSFESLTVTTTDSGKLKQEKTNFCVLFMVQWDFFFLFFFSQHKPSIALSFNAVKQTSVSPSSAVHIQRLACFIQVTAESEQKTFVYQGHIHNKDFGKFHLTRQGGLVSAFARNGKKNIKLDELNLNHFEKRQLRSACRTRSMFPKKNK